MRGRFYTDGSGGKFSDHPLIRRVGAGLAALDDTGAFLWGAFAACPGQWQTVPFAELFAVYLVLLLASPGATLEIFLTLMLR